MLDRCENPRHVAYERYGGRGIAVCESWHDFRDFFADMGERPSLDYSLDRINNDGNYESGNCKWSTRQEQAQNRHPRRWTAKRPVSTHCKRGHLLDEANIYISPKGKRYCRTCMQKYRALRTARVRVQRESSLREMAAREVNREH